MRAAEALDRLCDGAAGEPALRVLLVAAHPDDETIGAGDRLARLRAACTVVHVTDGAPRDPRFFARSASGLSREAYARLRREEARAALELAGLPPSQIVALGLRDLEASFEMAGIAEKVAALCAEIRPDLLLTHAYEGGHPDHDATAFAVHAAAALGPKPAHAKAADAEPATPTIVEMTSYHDEDGRTIRGEFLPPPGAPDVGTERIVALGEEEQRRKRAMLAAFTSQAEVLAPFPVAMERFRPAPSYEFDQAPHAGSLHYERSGFTLSGARWRVLARCASRRLGLRVGPL